MIYTYKLKTVLLALLFTLFWSCSKRQTTNAKIIVSGLSFLESNSDLIISGASEDQDYFSIVVHSGVSTASITIPTGSWKFYGLHINSSGNSMCTYKEKEITGDLQLIDLEYKKDSCNNQIFGNENNYNEITGFNKIKIFSCNDISSLTSDNENCGEGNAGVRGSYQIFIPSVELSTVHSAELGEDKISLGCHNINSDSFSISNYKLPLGNARSLPLFYEIKMYSAKDCVGEPYELSSEYSLYDLKSEGILKEWPTTLESETYSTIFFQNKRFQNGSTCSADNQCESTNCENSTCQSIKCEASEVANSNYSETDSLTGRSGDSVKISCNEGYIGGGDWACESTGSWNGQSCNRDGPEYIGCFTDRTTRAMSARSSNISNWETMSEEELANACNVECQGYDYFGIEYRNECFCDDTYDSYGEGITLSIEQLESGLKTATFDRGSGYTGYCAEDKSLNDNALSNWALKVYRTQSIDCPSSSVANSDYSRPDSLQGSYNDPAINITCDSEYSGGGSWTCDSSGAWVGDSCTIDSSGGICGNGVVEGSESCDDGNTITELACDYGIASCSACNSDCSATLALSGSYCRDGSPDFNEGEECDTGGATTSCNADCTTNNDNAFISLWTVPGSDKSITIPTNSDFSYDYIINWGDGNSERIIDSQSTNHHYTAAGSYTITISGTFPSIAFNNGGDKDKITSISNLGNVGWTSFENAFYGCSNLGSVSGGVTDNITSMQNMFRAASNATPDTSGWDTSSVTNMSGMFMNADSSNPSVSDWDTSSVTDMSLMFRGADIATPTTTSWNVSSVTDMTGMFRNAPYANPNTSGWNVSNVTTMKEMFKEADLANPNTSSWVTTSLTSTEAMFQDAIIANPDTSSWDTSSITIMRYMFDGATSANPDTSGWDTSNVYSMSYMFNDATSADPDTSGWDVSSVMSFMGMFQFATSADPDTSSWDTSGASFYANIFNGSGIDSENYSKFLIMAGECLAEVTPCTRPENTTIGNIGDGNVDYYTGDAADARDELIDIGWSFTDGDEIEP